MKDTGEETRRRPKPQTGEATLADVDMRPDQIGQIMELIKPIDHSWLDMLGDWIGSIGDALEGLDLGDISFD